MTDDPLLQAARKCLQAALARDDERQDLAIARWASGQRKPNSWYYKLSRFGRATAHFGDACRVFRAARDAVPRPLPRDQEREALGLAVDVLNRLGFLLRYGGLRTHNIASYSGGDTEEEALIFADIAIADLGAALALLANFGGLAHPTAAERLHNERVVRTWQEERGHV